MDLKTPTATTTPEAETEAPPSKHPSKCLSFANGSLKTHLHNHHSPPSQPVVLYKECLKNHAAALGIHALDGCGEFMPSPAFNPADPTSLKCAACGCHRNFHRRDPEEQGTHLIEYQPPPQPLAHTAAHLPAQTPQPNQVRSPSSISPPPISSSYYPSAPHMLLALSTGGLSKPESHSPMGMSSGSRKRFRTKFSQEQKDKMYSFSERLGWKMQKRDEGLVEEFCSEVGVGKGVLKVWMHNNKHTFGKRDVNGGGGSGSTGSGSVAATHHLLHHNTSNTSTTPVIITPPTTTITAPPPPPPLNHHHNNGGGNGAHVGTNCSSSSS